MDIVLEYIIKKKNTSKDNALIIGTILAALILTQAILTISLKVLNLGTFGFIVIAAIWFGVYWLLTMRSKEFEYSITNGELDIDMIIARRKRKHLLSVKTRQFELCANVHDPAFQQALNEKKPANSIIMAASEKNAPRTYFVDLIAHDGKPYRLFFEPTSKMLEAFSKYNPQNVHIYACAED